MNVGSLFSGIGGIDLGLERAGMRVVWQVECDPYARAVLRKHWPAAALYDDVRGVGAANLAPVDLVCGGFPCQDISNAGKRVGIDGERSGLWSEYARIVRELRPRYVLVENVAALLARGLERVVGDLATCGYDAEWDCFPAASFGAPHRRDRLFIVAYANGELVGLQSKPEPRRRNPAFAGNNGTARPLANADPHGQPSKRRHVSEDGDAFAGHHAHGRGRSPALAYPAVFRERESADAANAESVSGKARAFLGGGSWWAAEPALGRVVDGVPDRLAWERELAAFGNACVPQVAEWIGRQILAHANGSVTDSQRSVTNGQA